MAWTAPITFVPGVLTASQLNTYLRDNMVETMPAKATAAGNHFVTTARNEMSERLAKQGYIATSQTSVQSDGYVDLATSGPYVACLTGPKALVTVSCLMSHSTTAAVFMGYAVSGATEIDPTDDRATLTRSDQIIATSATFLQEGLEPGVNTFTTKYRNSGAGTGTFTERRINVFPL